MIDIQFSPILSYDVYKDDENVTINKHGFYSYLQYKGEDIIRFYSNSDYDLDYVILANYENEDIVYEFLAYMLDKYDVMTGFDGYGRDAGCGYLYELPSPENVHKYEGIDTYNTVVNELFIPEMLEFNFKLSDEQRAKLQQIYDSNHEQYVKYSQLREQLNPRPTKENTPEPITPPINENGLPF